MFLGDHFGYPSGVAHGVTVYLLNVLPSLKSSGIAVNACFMREPHPAAEELERADIKPIFLSASPLDPFVVYKVVDVVRRAGCRILHATGLKGTLVARIVGRILGIHVIVHVHDLIYPGRFLNGLQTLCSRPADIGIAVSHAVKEVLVDGYHVRPDRVRVIHNGLPLGRIRNVSPGTYGRVRKSLGISGNRSVVTMIGRMYPIKGHVAMIRMMARIVQSRPESMLLLAGDGPERVACEALSAELGLGDHIRFLGHRGDVPDLLAASELVVMPSQSEGFGLAAIEAMALGKPVVAFDCGGLRDVISDGSDGRLVAPDDEDGFVSAVVELIQNPVLREVYGQEAVIASEQFSLELHIEALLRCYAEINDGSVPELLSGA